MNYYQRAWKCKTLDWILGQKSNVERAVDKIWRGLYISIQYITVAHVDFPDIGNDTVLISQNVLAFGKHTVKWLAVRENHFWNRKETWMLTHRHTQAHTYIHTHEKTLHLLSLSLKAPKTINNTNLISNLQSLNVANEETEPGQSS